MKQIRTLIEGPVYSAGIHAYRQGIRLASHWNRKAALLDKGLRDVWNKLEGIRPDDRYLWFHAASLGEFEQGRPVMETLRRSHPEFKILLTFFSPSGYEVRKDYPFADIVCYLPIDTPANAKRFVERVNPEAAIFIKYEIWRNYLKQLKNRNIPTYLISAAFRPDQAFFKGYGAFYRDWLRNFDRLFVQDSESRRLLEGAGFKNVTVAGDTRFDRVLEIKDTAREIPEVEAFLGESEARPFTLVVGSSWESDEEIYSAWLDSRRDVKCIIAPHEFDASRLEKLRERFAGGACLLSEIKAGKTDGRSAQVLIIDCFGLLSSIYRYADLVYVGGGFGAGIHNLNEAAVYGVPVLFGPNHEKFIEARDLKTLGGGIAVSSRESFERNADRLLFDETERRRRGAFAAEYILEQAGATSRILSALFPS